jgi:hypothetical protein
MGDASGGLSMARIKGEIHSLRDLPHGNIKDMRDKRFGRLIVLEYAGLHGKGKRQRACWRCVCDCGKKTTVIGHSLRSGHTKSCGCLNREAINFSVFKHGMCDIPEYSIWRAMKSRCYGLNNAAFKHYGGRGIRVCQEWNDSFVAFLADMGKRPSDKYTLERIDNEGDYTPKNCRWATCAEQNRNNRRTRLLTFRNEILCVTDWAKALGMNRETLSYRLRHNWSVERALSTPVRGT